MGIKGIITLLAIGGIAGAGYYFKDGIKGAFADGKDALSNGKDKLQNGYQGGDSGNTSYTEPQSNNENDGKGQGGKDGNNSKENDTQIIYVPLYGNDGQQSYQKGQHKQDNNKPNPSITQYIKNDKKKTNDTISKYTEQANRNNQDAYVKKKYGIDYDLIKSGSSKSESKRTTEEKKQIEAAKARDIYDSRKYNNW
jgi:hypothetical protein